MTKSTLLRASITIATLGLVGGLTFILYESLNSHSNWNRPGKQGSPITMGGGSLSLSSQAKLIPQSADRLPTILQVYEPDVRVVRFEFSQYSGDTPVPINLRGRAFWIEVLPHKMQAYSDTDGQTVMFKSLEGVGAQVCNPTACNPADNPEYIRRDTIEARPMNVRIWYQLVPHLKILSWLKISSTFNCNDTECQYQLTREGPPFIQRF